MPTILEQLKSGGTINFNIQKLMPGTLAETTSGFFGLLPTTATMYCKTYWLKTGEELNPLQTIPLKTSGEIKSAYDLNAPVVGHSIYYAPDKDDIMVQFVWIEVSGAIIHPISIEAECPKGSDTPPIVAKGIFRNASSTPSGTYKFPDSPTECDKHTLQTILFYKYTLYCGADKYGYSYANPPQPSDFETLKNKINIAPDNSGYGYGFEIIKWRL